MAKVTYLGEDDGPEQIEMFGSKFKVGKSTDVSDDMAIRLMGNPFFKLDKPPSDDAAAAVTKPPVAAAQGANPASAQAVNK
jgi:hypothetical protein